GLGELCAVRRAVTAAEADLRRVHLLARDATGAAAFCPREVRGSAAQDGAYGLALAARRHDVARGPLEERAHREHLERVGAARGIAVAASAPVGPRRIHAALGAFAGALPLELGAKTSFALRAQAH